MKRVDTRVVTYPSDNCGDGTSWGCGRPVHYPDIKVLVNARSINHQYGPHVLFHSRCFAEVEADPRVQVEPTFARKLAQETASKGTR